MTNPNDPIAPIQIDRGTYSGLTIREHFALEFAKVLVSLDYDRALTESVRYADILIARLNEKTET